MKYKLRRWESEWKNKEKKEWKRDKKWTKWKKERKKERKERKKERKRPKRKKEQKSKVIKPQEIYKINWKCEKRETKQKKRKWTKRKKEKEKKKERAGTNKWAGNIQKNVKKRVKEQKKATKARQAEKHPECIAEVSVGVAVMWCVRPRCSCPQGAQWWRGICPPLRLSCRHLSYWQTDTGGGWTTATNVIRTGRFN